MNQYLQRMALSAIKPGGTIHPIVDSVYSPRRDYSYKPWIDENESVAETNVDQGPKVSTAPAIMATPLQTAGITDASPLAKPTMDKIEPAVTEQPGAQRSRPSSVHPVGAETIAAVENTRVHAAGSRNKAEVTGQAALEEAVPGEVQRTQFLRPEIGVERASSRLPKVVSASRNAGAVEPEARRLQRSGPAVHEPEEIQIHIGRIEVTAVAQAPAPAAAKPQRNVPSLDEYLKRRDRRAP